MEPKEGVVGISVGQKHRYNNLDLTLASEVGGSLVGLSLYPAEYDAVSGQIMSELS